MTAPIGAIGGITPIMAPASVGTASAAGGATDFAAQLSRGLDSLQGSQSKADDLAVKAATGDLQDAHDYMIASTEAKLATETVVTLKNSAVSAFTEIMRMPV